MDTDRTMKEAGQQLAQHITGGGQSIRCRDLPDRASRVEWDLLVALSAAVGIERARTLRVFSRYSTNIDSIDLLVSYDGKSYESPALNTAASNEYLRALVELVNRMLERKC